MRSLRYLLVLALLGSLTACDLFQRRNRAFDDEPKLEFFPLKNTVDEGAGSTSIEIQLIGRQRDSDLPVSFTVDDSSTAQAGTHYNLPTKSATIPADSSQTEVTVEVLDNDVDDADTDYQLYLTLQPSSGIEPAENLKTHALTIRGVDEQ